MDGSSLAVAAFTVAAFTVAAFTLPRLRGGDSAAATLRLSNFIHPLHCICSAYPL